MRKTRITALMFAVFMLFAATMPAGAITNGELDGEGHPGVVLILMEEEGEPAYRCTGTMIAPTYVLTAGHCVVGDLGKYSGIRIFTESDVDLGTIIGTNNYPYAGPNSIEAVRWDAHPDYTSAEFFLHDVGMIELEEAFEVDDYGVLPELDQLDALKTRRGVSDTWFTAVGYGLQYTRPVYTQADRVRMVAYPELIQINAPGFTGDYSMLLSNNHSTGGTCFGDSGGPNFIGDSMIVGGVTSFGINNNCVGTGGVFRVDRENVLDFIDGFMNPPPP